MPARVKLKGIDGGPHKRWSMWFNSMIREAGFDMIADGAEMYQRSNTGYHRCCMAVVSSCREVLG